MKYKVILVLCTSKTSAVKFQNLPFQNGPVELLLVASWSTIRPNNFTLSSFLGSSAVRMT